MIVFFQDQYGNRQDIGRASDFQDACHIIRNFLHQRGYESPYSRFSQEGPEVFVDVGSWSEFFYVQTGMDFDLNECLRSES